MSNRHGSDCLHCGERQSVVEETLRVIRALMAMDRHRGRSAYSLSDIDRLLDLAQSEMADRLSALAAVRGAGK